MKEKPYTIAEWADDNAFPSHTSGVRKSKNNQINVIKCAFLWVINIFIYADWNGRCWQLQVGNFIIFYKEYKMLCCSLQNLISIYWRHFGCVLKFMNHGQFQALLSTTTNIGTFQLYQPNGRWLYASSSTVFQFSISVKAKQTSLSAVNGTH